MEVMVAERKSRRKGLAVQAVQLMISHAVQCFKVPRFVVKIAEENEPSLRMFRDKLGFAQYSYNEDFGEHELEYVVPAHQLPAAPDSQDSPKEEGIDPLLPFLPMQDGAEWSEQQLQEAEHLCLEAQRQAQEEAQTKVQTQLETWKSKRDSEEAAGRNVAKSSRFIAALEKKLSKLSEQGEQARIDLEQSIKTRRQR